MADFVLLLESPLGRPQRSRSPRWLAPVRPHACDPVPFSPVGAMTSCHETKGRGSRRFLQGSYAISGPSPIVLKRFTVCKMEVPTEKRGIVPGSERSGTFVAQLRGDTVLSEVDVQAGVNDGVTPISDSNDWRAFRATENVCASSTRSPHAVGRRSDRSPGESRDAQRPDLGLTDDIR